MTLTKCPKCNAPIENEQEQCARCGIFFDKWHQREENVATGNMSRYDPPSLTSSSFNWAILLIVAVIVAGIFYYLELSQ